MDDCCLTSNKQFVISWRREQVTFWRDYDDVRFVRDKTLRLNFFVVAHWNNSPRIDCRCTRKQYNEDPTSSYSSNPRFTTLDTRKLIITRPMRYIVFGNRVNNSIHDNITWLSVCWRGLKGNVVSLWILTIDPIPLTYGCRHLLIASDCTDQFVIIVLAYA